jgi:transcriptional regulator with XRE-family HTH domain
VAASRRGTETPDEPQTLPPDATERIGRLLGDAREAAGVSQATAARVLHAAQSRIAKIELGTRQVLLHEAVLLADLYGVSLERLDPRTNDPRPREGRRRRVDSASRTGGESLPPERS